MGDIFFDFVKFKLAGGGLGGALCHVHGPLCLLVPD